MDAERAVRRAASRLVRAWLLSLGATLLFLGAVVAAVTAAALTPGWRLFTGLSVFLLFAVGLLVRLTPREPVLSVGVEPPDEEMAPFCDWIALRCEGWRPRVRFTWAPSLWVERGTLLVGLPVLLGTREEELTVLLEDARATAGTELRRPVALAQRLVRGSVGRRLLDAGTPSFTSRVITDVLEARMRALEEALSRLVHVRRVADGDAWAMVEGRVEVLSEAWDLFVDATLAPALARGEWHQEPFSGLLAFLGACELAGWVESADRLPGRDAVDSLPPLGSVEHQVAAELVSGSECAEEPISWAEHPLAVTVPDWRVRVAEGVRAAALVTGSPVPATVSALLRLAEEAGPSAWTAALSLPSGTGTVPVDETAGETVLVAATSLLLVDSGAAVPSWEWPVGTVLRDRDGRGLEVRHRVVDEQDHLEDWLRELGVDPTTPVWLAEGVPPRAEDALLAVNVTVRRRRRRLVLGSEALHLFPKPAAMWSGRSLRTGGPFEDPCMTAVEDQQLAPEVVSIPYDDIAHADLVPKLGDDGWRLSVTTMVGGTTTISVDTRCAQEEAVLEEKVGRRLEAHRCPPGPALRRFARWGAYPCRGIGWTAVVFGLVWWLVPDDGVARGAAVAVGVVGVGVFVAGFLPTLVTHVRQQRSASRAAARRHQVRAAGLAPAE